MKKGKAGFWIGFIIAIGFVAWAFFQYDFESVWVVLKGVNYWWVVAAGIVETLLIYVRAVRWHYFLEPIKKVSHYNVTMATAIGFMANSVAPGRIGEFIRPYLLGKRENISKSAAFGTVVIERAIDGLSVVVLILIVFFFVEVPPDKEEAWGYLKGGGYIISLFFLVVSTGLFLLHKRIGWVERLIEFLIRLLPEKHQAKVRELIESFISGFDVLEHSRHLIAIIIWSVILWTVAGGLNLAFFYAFDLGDLPFIATYLVLMAQVAGVMIPTPGFVGPYHAGTVIALSFYGVGAELALSMAVVMHATMFITNAGPGVVFLWLENISLGSIKEEQGM